MKKKKRRSIFNEVVNINYSIKKITGNEIITDAGWEKLSFESAKEFFSVKELQEWYSSSFEGSDYSELLVELGVSIDPCC